MNNPVDIRPDHLEMVQDILREHLPAGFDVWVFGSRANWTTKDSSDLDLAVEGAARLDHKAMVRLEIAFEESGLPYTVDVVDLSAVSPEFKRIVDEQKAPLPESFHREIERDYAMMRVGAPKTAASVWREVPVSEVVTATIGGTPSRKVEQYWKGSYPWATAKDVANAGSRYLNAVQESITDLGLAKSAAKVMPKGTILITSRGTVGALAQLGCEMAFNQTCYALRPTDDVENDYLYYALKFTRPRMEALTYGTVFQTITTKSFAEWQIPLPPLPEQRRIAHILGALDDKIELNRRMNETLEAMARAVFQDWFVDFGPVRARMEGREPYLPLELWDLFPDRLVDSELGEIPEGWEVKALGEVSNLNPESWSRANCPAHVEYVDLANTKWGVIESTQHFAWQGAPSRAKRVLRTGDTIVGTVRPGNGSYSLIGNDGLTGSTGFAVLRPSCPRFRELVYLSATAPENIEWLAHRADGAAYPAVRPEIVSETEIATPPMKSRVLDWFSETVGPVLDKMESAKAESRALAAQRDVLLPKLVSGELRVETIEVTEGV